MLLNVKILGSSSSNDAVSVEVLPEESVEALKAKLEQRFQLEKGAEQKLVYQGKTLQDGTSLASYKLTNGAKLHLILKQTAGAATTAAAAVSPSVHSAAAKAQNIPRQSSIPNPDLDETLFKELRKFFRSDDDTRKVVKAFKKDFHGKLASLNLDDIERVASHYNETSAIKF